MYGDQTLKRIHGHVNGLFRFMAKVFKWSLPDPKSWVIQLIELMCEFLISLVLLNHFLVQVYRDTL